MHENKDDVQNYNSSELQQDKEHILPFLTTIVDIPDTLKDIIPLQSNRENSKRTSFSASYQSVTYRLKIKIDKGSKHITASLQWPSNSDNDYLDITTLLTKRQLLYLALLSVGDTNGLIPNELQPLIRHYCSDDTDSIIENMIVKQNIKTVATELNNLDNFSVIKNLQDMINGDTYECCPCYPDHCYYINGQEDFFIHHNNSLCDLIQKLEQLMHACFYNKSINKPMKDDQWYPEINLDLKGITTNTNSFKIYFEESIQRLENLKNDRGKYNKNLNNINQEYYKFEKFVITLLACIYGGDLDLRYQNNTSNSKDKFFYSSHTRLAIISPNTKNQVMIDLWELMKEAKCERLESGIYNLLYKCLQKKLKNEGETIKSKIEKNYGTSISNEKIVGYVENEDKRLSNSKFLIHTRRYNWFFRPGKWGVIFTVACGVIIGIGAPVAYIELSHDDIGNKWSIVTIVLICLTLSE